MDLKKIQNELDLICPNFTILNFGDVPFLVLELRYSFPLDFSNPHTFYIMLKNRASGKLCYVKLDFTGKILELYPFVNSVGDPSFSDTIPSCDQKSPCSPGVVDYASYDVNQKKIKSLYLSGENKIIRVNFDTLAFEKVYLQFSKEEFSNLPLSKKDIRNIRKLQPEYAILFFDEDDEECEPASLILGWNPLSKMHSKMVKSVLDKSVQSLAGRT